MIGMNVDRIRNALIWVIIQLFAWRISGRAQKFLSHYIWPDRLCGLVVRVSSYRSRGPGFDFRRYRIFWEVVGPERGPLSLVRIIEELLEG
jgi:hypothetical protein